MKKNIISTTKAPKAIGPYVQGVKLNHSLYLSGQLGIDPVSGNLLEGIELQTKQCLKNISAILEEADYTFQDIVKTTVYVKNIADFDKVNAIYAEYFKDSFPARSLVEVNCLPKNALVEIEAIAVK